MLTLKGFGEIFAWAQPNPFRVPALFVTIEPGAAFADATLPRATTPCPYQGKDFGPTLVRSAPNESLNPTAEFGLHLLVS